MRNSVDSMEGRRPRPVTRISALAILACLGLPAAAAAQDAADEESGTGPYSPHVVDASGDAASALAGFDVPAQIAAHLQLIQQRGEQADQAHVRSKDSLGQLRVGHRCRNELTPEIPAVQPVRGDRVSDQHLDGADGIARRVFQHLFAGTQAVTRIASDDRQQDLRL